MPSNKFTYFIYFETNNETISLRKRASKEDYGADWKLIKRTLKNVKM